MTKTSFASQYVCHFFSIAKWSYPLVDDDIAVVLIALGIKLLRFTEFRCLHPRTPLAQNERLMRRYTTLFVADITVPRKISARSYKNAFSTVKSLNEAKK